MCQQDGPLTPPWAALLHISRGRHLPPGLFEQCSWNSVVHSLGSCIWQPWLPLLQMSWLECISHFPSTSSAFTVPCLDLVGKFFQLFVKCVTCGLLSSVSHPWRMPADWEQESKVNKYIFIMKPISWGNGSNRRREIRKGTYRGSVWGGEKEVGCEEGREG